MLSILGAGKAHPDNVIDNAFLESLGIGTNNEWIMERVGIAERRTVLPLDYIRTTLNKNPVAAAEAAEITTTELGVKAALMAIERAGIKPEQIGMVIAGTCVPQMALPAHACLIAASLGITAPAFDLNSACSSSSAQLHFINSMQPDLLPDYILLVQPETMTLVTNYSDRSTAVLFGDAAAAQVISPRHKGKAQVLTTLFESDPAGYSKVITPAHGHFSQEGSAVQRFAILQTVHTIKKLQQQMPIEGPSYFIGHQANLRMLESSCTRLEVPADKHLYNIDKYGNCGAAGGPSVLAERWDAFVEGDYLSMATVGSGLSWGGAILRFGERS